VLVPISAIVRILNPLKSNPTLPCGCDLSFRHLCLCLQIMRVLDDVGAFNAMETQEIRSALSKGSTLTMEALGQDVNLCIGVKKVFMLIEMARQVSPQTFSFRQHPPILLHLLVPFTARADQMPCHGYSLCLCRRKWMVARPSFCIACSRSVAMPPVPICSTEQYNNTDPPQSNSCGFINFYPVQQLSRDVRVRNAFNRTVRHPQ